MAILLGIDTGGTYTDAVLFDDTSGQVVAKAKSLTTRHDLAIGISGAVDRVIELSKTEPSSIELVSLSTTLATNALVEGQQRRIGLVMIGFGEADAKRAGLDTALGNDPIIHILGGHTVTGDVAMPLDLVALENWLLNEGGTVTGYAIAGYFSTRNPEHEIAARDLIRTRTNLPVTCSHELTNQLDGPRRALTCLLNARLIPLIDGLIEASGRFLEIRGINAPVMVVRGDGALIAADIARERPIETILSGPAATLVGAGFLTGSNDAIVSDIGGTTTDIAVMKNGTPRLDPLGARVGGFQTMVQAVAMRTIGLGGDSEVRLVEEGLTITLELGPRRAMPISLLAIDHRAMVHQELDRQLRAEIARPTDARFVVPMSVTSAARAGLSPAEASLLTKIGNLPNAIDKVAETRTELGALTRLVTNGLVMISTLTPSDAAHVLGIHQTWDREAAMLAAELVARRRGGKGEILFETKEDVAYAVIKRLVRRSAEALIDVALDEDGFKLDRPSLHPLIVASLDKKHGVSSVRFDFNLPIIGVGASAPTYYPMIGELLDSETIMPEHADVANALGAVVGHVKITGETVILSPGSGRFRIHGPASSHDFHDLESAARAAIDGLRKDIALRAEAAGADNAEISIDRKDVSAFADGQDIFVESRITAMATGRPRLVKA
ncbi:MAG: hydantoinase/oxoprolinase family protein [Alphaproteobacteria bacterium]|nr:hydantoinase/oxoprolinase family protein [Beijerinckiaceae bacterium]NBQ38769.1 hydantoinase/oxoprolinase family protein [Alphaproteobacteria bacterium]